MPRHAKKSISCIWASYFFLEYPFGTPYLELSSEIPAQDFNLLDNIDNFFPVFLLMINLLVLHFTCSNSHFI